MDEPPCAQSTHGIPAKYEAHQTPGTLSKSATMEITSFPNPASVIMFSPGIIKGRRTNSVQGSFPSSIAFIRSFAARMLVSAMSM